MSAQTLQDKHPHPIDVHVGLRVRMRRKQMKMSQTELANALSLTFQQIQKYERGTNRIGASKLCEMARALRVPVGYFFEGCENGDEQAVPPFPPESIIQAFLRSRDGLELASTFPRIPEAHVKRRILDLVRSLVKDTNVEPS